MNTKRFWQLIETTKGEHQPRLLERMLLSYPVQEIEVFDRLFHGFSKACYKENGVLWQALAEVVGFVSDDSFEYFTAWLIGQGKDTYNEVVRCPARISEFVTKESTWMCEEMLYAAMNAIETVKAWMPLLMAQEQFEELCEYLDSEQGCNFHERVPGDSQSVTWKCDNTLAMTRQWLQEHGLNVDANVGKLQALGGFCDCEVLFNTTERW